MRLRHGLLVREVIVLVSFALLAVLLTYPLSLHPATMVPDPTDPLLSAWRLHWVGHTLLSGADALSHLFDANIFYPYPLTLAYSEHFIGETILALPLLLLADSHLVGPNLVVTLSFVLTAYATYLFVAGWSRSRVAGLVAGFLLAFSPLCMGNILHLELLTKQWMPLTLLALRWLVWREPGAATPGRRWIALVLCLVFFNLQALSSFYYTVYLALACAALVVLCLALRQIRWHWTLPRDLAILAIMTFGINWPIWSKYLEFSHLMGAIRSPGDVRVYSAAFVDYLTTIPQNMLYGWTFGLWQSPDHQFQPLAPTGIVGLALAVAGLVVLWRRGSARSHLQGYALFLVVMGLIGFVLSLGTNDRAFGDALAPLMAKLLPYQWLYEYVPGFTGMRVPARAAVLVAFGLAGLAGVGGAWVWGRLSPRVPSSGVMVPLRIALLCVLGVAAVAEYWSVPLEGPQIPSGASLPTVYRWLQGVAPDAVLLELPQRGASEFAYEYYSTYHWRRLVNGASGYTPAAHREMRDWFKTFPDWRTVEVIQQLGVDYVILHASAFAADEWEQVQGLLPAFLPAFDGIWDVGTSRVLRVAPPQCRARYEDDVAASLAVSAGDGGDTAVVTLRNDGATTFVADVARPSRLTLDGRELSRFLEPLVVLPGQSRSVRVPLRGVVADAGRLEAHLSTLGRVVAAGDVLPSLGVAASRLPAAPLNLVFLDGGRLVGYALAPDVLRVCDSMILALDWEQGTIGDRVVVELVDRFARVVLDSHSTPWNEGSPDVLDVHRIPLPGTLPPGAYSLRVRVLSADGGERPIVTEQGGTLEVSQLAGLPVVIHPQPVVRALGSPLARFSNDVVLVAADLSEVELRPGDWWRFTLFWRGESAVDQELTVFTQLVGPDGRVWGQRDNPPRGGWYPTSLWRPGEVVDDHYALQVDGMALPGDYQLIVGLYDATSGVRMPVLEGVGRGSDFVPVAHLTVAVAAPE